jgi:hypothetical protein
MAQATGLFGLKPWQFWDLTPREFANMGEGYRMRNDIEWQRTAQLASWIMSAQLGKKAPTADKLLGKDKRKERTNKVVSIEEKRKTLAELEESLGKAVN